MISWTRGLSLRVKGEKSFKSGMNDFSKTLIIFGIALIGIGLLAALFTKVPGLGKLPGDITIQKGSFTFYFPLATCLILSLILTLVFTLFGKK